MTGARGQRLRSAASSAAALAAFVAQVASRRGSKALTEVRGEALAGRTLLGIAASCSVEAAGVRRLSDAYVWRQFRSERQSGEELFLAVVELAHSSGWVTWRRERAAPDGWMDHLRKGNSGLWSIVQVHDRVLSVKVGKDRPGSRSGPPDEDQLPRP